MHKFCFWFSHADIVVVALGRNKFIWGMTMVSEQVGTFLKSALSIALYYIAISFASHIKGTYHKVIHKLKRLMTLN